ncbi:hypothetical protein FJT64_002551 [Amphibalanus amphitrite]|uniref:Uncharacterized protein n=1 Tax=Amphibalanus amphitrite TaxID=1232801 RepID=A0A6A4WHW0_AMPAM|nr:hypothetical protein FJT64_002551 [Amphibalanus amphitrite]
MVGSNWQSLGHADCRPSLPSLPPFPASHSRRAFISTCQDQLASYLMDLRASSDPDAGLLAARLKDTKAALERLRQAPVASDSSGLGALGLGLGRSPARR